MLILAHAPKTVYIDITKKGMQEELEKVLPAVVETVLDFFKVHRKIVFGNTSVIVEDVFGKRPETLDAVDMICGAFVDHAFAVVDGVMFAVATKRLVTSKGIRVIDRTFAGSGANMGHERVGGDILNHTGVNASITFQQAKYNAFPAAPRPRLPLHRPPKYASSSSISPDSLLSIASSSAMWKIASRSFW